MGNKITPQALRRLQHLRTLQIAADQSEAIDPPGLSPGPGGPVIVALMCPAPDSLSGSRIEVEGMVARIIAAHQKTAGLAGMKLSRAAVRRISGLLRSPEQQRQIEQAVNNNPPAIHRIAFRPPGLN
ncbi:hypothetical protein D3C75_815170 [compost metagenome]